MLRTLILPALLVTLLSACAESRPPELAAVPAPAETIVVFAPVDSSLTEEEKGPDLDAAAVAIAAAQKAAGPLPSLMAQLEAALKVIGIYGVLLFDYDEALTSSNEKLAKIRATQNKQLPAP